LAFRFTPFDSQLLISLEPSENGNALDFCYGMQFLVDVMDFEILLEVDVLECEFGLFGFLIGDQQDCYWKKYPLTMPIAQVHFLNALDTVSPLIPWFCTFEMYIDQEDENLTNDDDRGYEEEYFATDN
jgi:hypothetical protein